MLTLKGVPNDLKEVKEEKHETFDSITGILDVSGEPIIISMGKSHKAPKGGLFLPSCVKTKERMIWTFFSEKEKGFQGIAKLVEYKDEYVIVLIEKNKLMNVLPLADLVKSAIVKTAKGEFKRVGMRNIEQLLQMKAVIAKELDLKPCYSNNETLFDQSVRAKEKQDKISGILRRKEIIVYTSDGRKLGGIPVVGNEWAILPAGTRVILVEKHEEGKIGKLLEAFIVKQSTGKEGKRKKLNRRTDIQAERPNRRKEVVPDAVGEIILVDMDGVTLEMVHIKEKDIERLIHRGINSGNTVAVGLPRDGKVKIVAFEGSIQREVGFYPFVSA